MKLKTVTVTGADDSVKPEDLVILGKKYPFAEFGILLSRKQMGSARFPSKEWLKELIGATFGVNEIPLSGHICGSWVREIFMGNWPELEFMDLFGSPYAGGLFQRFQLNTHAQFHEMDIRGLQKELWGLGGAGASVIFQYDDNSGSAAVAALKVGQTAINALFDLSHGAGILPSKWPHAIPGVYCGYAGGLSPENVVDQLSSLELMIPAEIEIWIDAETHLRSQGWLGNQKFDLERVEAFLQAAKPWVAGETTV